MQRCEDDAVWALHSCLWCLQDYQREDPWGSDWTGWASQQYWNLQHQLRNGKSLESSKLEQMANIYAFPCKSIPIFFHILSRCNNKFLFLLFRIDIFYMTTKHKTVHDCRDKRVHCVQKSAAVTALSQDTCLHCPPHGLLQPLNVNFYGFPSTKQCISAKCYSSKARVLDQMPCSFCHWIFQPEVWLSTLVD